MMEYVAILMNVLCSVLIVGGVIMTMVGLPGNVLIVLVGLAYGYYEHVDYSYLGIIVGIFMIGELVEFWAGLIGARQEKASKRAVLAAFVGTVLGGVGGTVILPIIGSMIGAVVGAFMITALAEYTKTKNKQQAKRVAMGVVKGQIVGMAFKVVAAVGMAITLISQLKWQ